MSFVDHCIFLSNNKNESISLAIYNQTIYNFVIWQKPISHPMESVLGMPVV
jgi:hypothetical protein